MRVLTQGEIEEQMMAAVEALDDTTNDFADVADLAATAEADYKLRHARAIVTLSGESTKMTAPEKAARAELAAATELREWKLATAQVSSTKEALLSLRARLDALRSLSANVRAQT